ncbi:MAG: acetyltransferase [Pseudanabaenaceae cyanobacterium]|jgi:sugar O-acyltransferase (sialic acid O-acetyltransferase NeuD family)
MTGKKKYVIWGSSGHSKVLHDLLRLCGGDVIALFDNNPNALPSIEHIPLYIGLDGFHDWVSRQSDIENIYGIAAIGGSYGRDRIGIHELFRSSGIKVETVKHPSAYVCQSATIGEGCQLLCQSLIATDSILGESCIVNHQASVDHECHIGKGVHLAPSSTLCGCINLGDNVMIGAGAVVLPRISIGENTVVGAGSTVTRDLPSNVVAVGSPARIIRHI